MMVFTPKTLVRLGVEATLMVLALLCGAWIRFWNDPVELELYLQYPGFVSQAIVAVVILQVSFYYSDLYDPDAPRRLNQQILSIVQSLGAGSLLLGFLYYAFPQLLISRGVFFISVLLAVVFIAVGRAALDAAWDTAVVKQNVVVLGTGNLAATVAREIETRPDSGLRFAGFIASTDARNGDFHEKWHILGGSSELESIVPAHHVSRIVVALEDRRGTLPVRDLVTLRLQGVQVEDAQSTISSLTGRVWLETLRPSWFVFSEGFRRSRVLAALKRTTDLLFAFVGLLLSAPLMLLVAVAIRLDSKGPVLYKQTRVGLGGRHFELFKFRSMRTNAEINGAQWASQDDPRVTRLGKFLRKYRIDELPQFVNVLLGDMSFVGPRPERPVFVQTLREQIVFYDERHSVRPGVTGWAQIRHSYGSTFEDAVRKLEYDLFYLKNMSLAFDCAIVVETVRIVLTGRGGR